MTWEEALQLLQIHIFPNSDLDVNAEYKIVINIPAFYNCNKYGFGGETGYKIQVGKKDFIDVPLSMLKNCIKYSQDENNAVYNKNVFENLYPIQFNGKPCYVHAIGKLFVKAKIARQINSRNYKIL